MLYIGRGTTPSNFRAFSGLLQDVAESRYRFALGTYADEIVLTEAASRVQARLSLFPLIEAAPPAFAAGTAVVKCAMSPFFLMYDSQCDICVARPAVDAGSSQVLQKTVFLCPRSRPSGFTG